MAAAESVIEAPKPSIVWYRSVPSTTIVGASPGAVDALAAGFVAFRVGYTAAYVLDRPVLRSALWFLAIGCVIALFLWG